MHTYIIGHYNPSVRITAQLLTPLMLCAFILYVSFGTYSLTSTQNDRFFFRSFLIAEILYQKSAEKKSPKKYIFRFEAWPWLYIW